MSWLTGGLTQSVTGKLSQITGQFKEILTEGTEDVVDPNTELHVVNEKLKENEKRLEIIKMECERWQEEAKEADLRCKTYEAQLEQRNDEYRNQMLIKDSQINELRKQINSIQDSKNDSSTFDLNTSTSLTSTFQKSALMEEFEEVLPPNELNEFINLQKEIKRLNDDNLHLSQENKQLLLKLKKYENNISNQMENNLLTDNFNLNDQKIRQYEIDIENLKQEIYKLRDRLNSDKDKHQEEIIAIQQNYANKTDKQLQEKQNEIEILRIKLEELQVKFDEKQKEFDDFKSSGNNVASSGKSDDGWCLNGDEVNFDKIEIKSLKDKLMDKDAEIVKLQSQIDMFENDLEQANHLITRLKQMNKSASQSPSKSDDSKEIEEKLNKKIQELNEIIKKERQDNETKLREKLNELENQDKIIDSLNLELKQLQQSLQQEKMMQIQLEKKEQQEIASLKSENNELKIKLDEKLSEIKLLGDQINDINTNLNNLKTNDANLFDELKHKTEEFMQQLNSAAAEIASLKLENEQLKEQRKQFEFVLDEKTRESSQLKNDIQKHLQHIASLSNQKEEETNENNNELNLLKEQYNQVYAHLEQKNQESLNYYNEILRLNGVLSELNTELQNAKSMNENLNEQYDNLCKEFQTEQKIVEDLNQQINELTGSFLNAENDLMTKTESAPRSKSPKVKVTLDNETQTDSIEAEIEETTTNKTDDELKKNIENLTIKENENRDWNSMEEQLNQLKKENETLKEELKVRLEETSLYYEKIIGEQNENFKQTLLNEEQMQNNLSKELSNMRAHLEEMTNNFTREMQSSEERERQLRSDVTKWEEILRKQSENIENSNRELEIHKMNAKKLEEQNQSYENKLASLNETFKQQLMNEEQQQSRLKKELERLREHLVEMSESYNRDAIQAEEREKQLRLALNDAQQQLQNKDANLETSSKEIEYKFESLNQINLDLKNEKDKLKEKLKQTEENLSHQVKVTKNLELVLERLQNDKESMHSTEILRYQQTIKDQASTIHNLQKEAQASQAEIENLKNSLDSANIFMEELDRKDEILKQYRAQIGTKDALIESLDKRLHEIQRVNESHIEKEMIKNLVIGYIKVNQQHEKKQVLKLISTMLNFTPKEIELVESAGESKWFTNLLKPGATPTKNASSNSASADSPNKSFTELLIQYVDRESKPKPNIQFDLTDPNITHKKTDTTNQLFTQNVPSSSSASSAINFFNKSLVSQTGVNDSMVDNLVNRNQPIQPLVSSNTNNNNNNNSQTIPGVSSPAVANNFLEQILKS